LPGSDQIVNVEVIDGTIRRIGSIDPSMAAVETIDLGGRWLVPGLWDNHVHFSQWAQTARRLDVSTAMSAAKAALLVAGRAAAIPVGEVLIGFGFRDGLWPDACEP
jgi:predicted amidohydrolase YtcJ